MNIEFFGFKKEVDRWVTDYSYVNNITNGYYELKIINDGFSLLL